MNKSYVLGVWILGLSLLSSVAVTYATDETLEEQDSSVVFSHHFDKKEKKPEGKRDFKMEMKAPKDFKEFMDLCYKQKELYGNKFTYTLINEEDLIWRIKEKIL